MRQALYRMTGIDLTSIDGVGVDTAAVLTSELGLDFSAFPDERHFVSYLRLAPNISISAGKKVPGKFKAVTCTRVCGALRMAATSLRNSKTALGAYYRRISYRKGASVAVFATARKLAQLIYRLVRYGQAYVDTGADVYEARFAQRRLATYTRALKEIGYKIEPMTPQGARSPNEVSYKNAGSRIRMFETPDDAIEDGHRSLGSMGVARSKHRGHRKTAEPVEDQQGIKHVLIVIAVKE